VNVESGLPLQSIIDNVLNGIVIINDRGIISTFNRAAEAMFGYQAGEVIGKNISMLMAAQEAARHDSHLERYVSTGQTKIIGVGRDLTGKRKDGSEFAISLGVTEVHLNDAPCFIGVISDISERKKIEMYLMESAKELQYYHERKEEEENITQALMDKIVRREELNDPLLQWHVDPSESFSGDVIAAHRNPDGILYVLLADATGHGLAAAISLLPVLGVFYTMIDKRFQMSLIISEINKRLTEVLPVGRFVAAIFVGIDEKKRAIRVWNGGMPPCCLVSNVSGAIRLIHSNQLALGILKPDKFDDECIEMTLEEASDLVIFSDGLTEAENPQGEVFDMDRLQSIIRNQQSGDCFKQILVELDSHMAGKKAHDDVSVAMIHVP